MSMRIRNVPVPGWVVVGGAKKCVESRDMETRCLKDGVDAVNNCSVHRGHPLKDVLQFPAPDRPKQNHASCHHHPCPTSMIHPVAGPIFGPASVPAQHLCQIKRHDGIMEITASKCQRVRGNIRSFDRLGAESQSDPLPRCRLPIQPPTRRQQAFQRLRRR